MIVLLMKVVSVSSGVARKRFNMFSKGYVSFVFSPFMLTSKPLLSLFQTSTKHDHQLALCTHPFCPFLPLLQMFYQLSFVFLLSYFLHSCLWMMLSGLLRFVSLVYRYRRDFSSSHKGFRIDWKGFRKVVAKWPLYPPKWYESNKKKMGLLWGE